MASSADKDKGSAAVSAAAGTAPGSNNPAGPHVDFNSLPTSALASYIDYYSLAPNFPPPPAPRAYSRSPSESPEREEDDQVGGAGGDGQNAEGAEGQDTRTEEDLLAEASGKRRAALASAAATSTSYSKENKFKARSPPATTSAAASSSQTASKKRTAAEMASGSNAANGDPTGEPCPSEFFDEDDAKTYLANIAQKHFASQPPPKEGEIVVGFLYRCRTKELRYTKWSHT
ncbi:unnamed protein product [Parajaminaea phylloscopi]